jgi:hypothetical protein
MAWAPEGSLARVTGGAAGCGGCPGFARIHVVWAGSHKQDGSTAGSADASASSDLLDSFAEDPPSPDGMSQTAAPLLLTDEDRAELARWSQGSSPMLAERARIVLAGRGYPRSW